MRKSEMIVGLCSSKFPQCLLLYSVLLSICHVKFETGALPRFLLELAATAVCFVLQGCSSESHACRAYLLSSVHFSSTSEASFLDRHSQNDGMFVTWLRWCFDKDWWSSSALNSCSLSSYICIMQVG